LPLPSTVLMSILFARAIARTAGVASDLPQVANANHEQSQTQTTSNHKRKARARR
jgi:hypothetical protein